MLDVPLTSSSLANLDPPFAGRLTLPCLAPVTGYLGGRKYVV